MASEMSNENVLIKLTKTKNRFPNISKQKECPPLTEVKASARFVAVSAKAYTTSFSNLESKSLIPVISPGNIFFAPLYRPNQRKTIIVNNRYTSSQQRSLFCGLSILKRIEFN
jgi:hypothetical protein